MVSTTSFRRHARRAFSLVEMMAVISIISIAAGFLVPSLRGFNSSASLQTGARLMAGWLNVARSEAISRHTIVRFVVALEWPGHPEARSRKASLWAWDSEAEQFFPITAWQELPPGVVLERALPEYVTTAAYATADRSSTHGDFVLEEAAVDSPPLELAGQVEPVPVRYLEFTAAGNARVPRGSGRQAIFVMTPGVADADGVVTRTTNVNGHAANWAQINVDKLTGRVRILQP